MPKSGAKETPQPGGASDDGAGATVGAPTFNLPAAPSLPSGLDRDELRQVRKELRAMQESLSALARAFDEPKERDSGSGQPGLRAWLSERVLSA